MKSPTTPSLGLTWQQPTFLLPLFCLTTLLGSTSSLAVALGMALLLLLITLCFTVIVHSLGLLLRGESGTAVWLTTASVLIACVELWVHAALPELHRRLGIFLPMSIICCLLLARSELHTPRLADSLRRGLRMSAGYAFAALVLGAARELVGHGSLFADAGMLLGYWATPLEWQVFRTDMGFLLGILAPGAFIALGIGVALYNFLWLQLKKHPSAS